MRRLSDHAWAFFSMDLLLQSIETVSVLHLVMLLGLFELPLTYNFGFMVFFLNTYYVGSGYAMAWLCEIPRVFLC